MNDLDKIREFMNVQRKYASFYEWYKREKELKEIGIVQTLNESMTALKCIDTKLKIRASKYDPPDCIAETDNGELIGFEVRELVDQTAIERNEKGMVVYRDWDNSEVVQEIQKIIIEKDSKKYHGGPYRKITLVIPTNEPVLTYNGLKPILEAHTFFNTKQLDDAYLFFSYEAKTQSYPFLKLKIARKLSRLG